MDVFLPFSTPFCSRLGLLSWHCCSNHYRRRSSVFYYSHCPCLSRLRLWLLLPTMVPSQKKGMNTWGFVDSAVAFSGCSGWTLGFRTVTNDPCVVTSFAFTCSKFVYPGSGVVWEREHEREAEGSARRETQERERDTKTVKEVVISEWFDVSAQSCRNQTKRNRLNRSKHRGKANVKLN